MNFLKGQIYQNQTKLRIVKSHSNKLIDKSDQKPDMQQIEEKVEEIVINYIQKGSMKDNLPTQKGLRQNLKEAKDNNAHRPTRPPNNAGINFIHNHPPPGTRLEGSKNPPLGTIIVYKNPPLRTEQAAKSPTPTT